jgi:hypothetical protein
VAVAVLLTGSAAALGQNYSPSQAAYLKGEIRRAQERFVDQASVVSGVSADKIRQWVPTDGRDVPPKVRVIPALERERGKPMTDEERQKVLAADQARYDAIERAKRDALKK